MTTFLLLRGLNAVIYAIKINHKKPRKLYGRPISTTCKFVNPNEFNRMLWRGKIGVRAQSLITYLLKVVIPPLGIAATMAFTRKNVV
jgi:hypothetical protein